MTDIAALVRALADKGLSGHDIADVLEVARGVSPEVSEPTQSSAARRQKRYRDKQKALRVTGGDATDSHNASDGKNVTNVDKIVTGDVTPRARVREITSTSVDTGDISSLRSESETTRADDRHVTSPGTSLEILPGLGLAADLPVPTGKPKRSKTTKPPPAPAGEFEKWWDEYPNKVSKKEAIAAFDKAWALLSLSHDYPGDVLWNGLQNYKRKVHGWEKRHIRHAATWLNAENWNDEEHQDVSGTGSSPGGRGDQRADDLRSFFSPAAKARGYGD